ncbi:hypothetical protein HUJ04_006333 [Dendroctonus ponderosae]|nr:hypothetical protein HUJ04_006333 [Dendroctonus ponderosae]
MILYVQVRQLLRSNGVLDRLESIPIRGPEHSLKLLFRQLDSILPLAISMASQFSVSHGLQLLCNGWLRQAVNTTGKMFVDLLFCRCNITLLNTI